MKRGQFYIVTTIMIVAIIVGFASLSNFSQKRSSLKFFYEGEELELEASKVIDYGISQEDSSSGAMIDLMEKFARNYTEYSGADNLYFVVGVRKSDQPNDIIDVRFIIYQKTDLKTITLELNPAQTFTADELGVIYTEDYLDVGDWFNITIPDSEGNLTFDFEFKLGSSFYYVMTREIGGDRYLETNA